MTFNNLKFYLIIKDVLVAWFIIFLFISLYTVTFLITDYVYFANDHVKALVETEQISSIGFMGLVSMEFTLNIATFIAIYRSGQSIDTNKIMHMSCVAGILWLFTLSDIFFMEPDYFRYLYNFLIYAISIFTSYYIYKSQDRKNVSNDKTEN